MSQTVLTIEDAARSLPDVVERVHTTGEAALLVKSARPLAKIVPVANTARADGLIPFLRRWPLEHPEPDEQF